MSFWQNWLLKLNRAARAFDDRCPNDLTDPNRDNKKVQHQAGLNVKGCPRLIGTNIVSFLKYRREYIAWVIQGGTASFTDGIPFSSKATLKQKILDKHPSFAPMKNLAVDQITNDILLKFILLRFSTLTILDKNELEVELRSKHMPDPLDGTHNQDAFEIYWSDFLKALITFRSAIEKSRNHCEWY